MPQPRPNRDLAAVHCLRLAILYTPWQIFCALNTYINTYDAFGEIDRFREIGKAWQPGSTLECAASLLSRADQ